MRILYSSSRVYAANFTGTFSFVFDLVIPPLLLLLLLSHSFSPLKVCFEVGGNGWWLNKLQRKYILQKLQDGVVRSLRRDGDYILAFRDVGKWKMLMIKFNEFALARLEQILVGCSKSVPKVIMLDRRRGDCKLLSSWTSWEAGPASDSGLLSGGEKSSLEW